MRYGSVCSGIEAATVAWHGLGWKPVFFSEIESFPIGVLSHRFPEVPNKGDMTKYKEWGIARGSIDVLVGGTPCQAFSVAGLRGGLSDARGNLSLTYCQLADEIDPEWVVWENVPGVLSSKDNAFGCFLAGLCGADEPIVCGGTWPRAGVVSGPKRTAAWRILDAQYFGVAQRRRRVFVLAVRGSGNWAAAAALFPVGESVYGDSAPRRETGQETAGTLSARTEGGGFHGTDEARNGYVQPVIEPKWPAEIGSCLNAHFGEKQGVEDRHINQGAPLFVPANCGALTAKGPTAMGAPEVDAQHYIVHAQCVTGEITHALKAEGADASEDGTDRGNPIVPVTLTDCADTLTANWHRSGGATAGNNCGLINPIIAFTAKDYGADAAENIAPTLRAGGHTSSHQNAGVMPAVTVSLRGRDGGATAELGDDIGNCLRASQGGGDKPHVLAPAMAFAENSRSELRYEGGDGAVSGALKVGGGKPGQSYPVAQIGMAVRRLTPRECERLQGFPDDWTLVPVRGKPAADGPRYKAIGNSMAVPVMHWIGKRIEITKKLYGAAYEA